MTDLFSRVKAFTDIRVRPEDDDCVLLYNPRTDQLHMLGLQEGRIFGLCDGRSIDEIIWASKEALVASGVESDTVAAEVISLLRELHQRALVQFC